MFILWFAVLSLINAVILVLMAAAGLFANPEPTLDFPSTLAASEFIVACIAALFSGSER